MFLLIENANYATSVTILSLALTYVGYPIAIVLGIPLYLGLRHRLRPQVLTLMIVGGVVASVPWLVLLAWSSGSATHAEIGRCVAVIDGATTWCGYLENLKFLAMIFGLGALGGITFWLCVAWRDTRYAQEV